MKKLLLAAAVSVAAIAAPAMASTQLTILSPNTITVPPTALFSPSVVTQPGDTDLFYGFTLGSTFTLSASSFTNSAIPNSAFDFTSMTLYLNGTNTTPVAANYGATGTQLSTMAYTSGQQVTQVLAAGQYTIQLSGKATNSSTVGSSFVFAAPVPEAATWAMMLGGFGLVGGALRTSRRKAGFLNA